LRATPTADEFIADRKAVLVGRRSKMKDIGQRGWFVWECEAVTLMQQTNHPMKIFVVMRMRLVEAVGERFHGEAGAHVGAVEYRFGYYIVARNGKWWWGQYALIIPREDLLPLLAKARREGTLLEDIVATTM
jgi:hypothetical protein